MEHNSQVDERLHFLLVLPKKGTFREDFGDRRPSTNTLFLFGLIQGAEFLKGSIFILFYFVRQFSKHNL